MHITIVGAGHMGHGIALSYALGGQSVILVDESPEAIERAQHGIARASEMLQRAEVIAELQKNSARDLIQFTDNLAGACHDADLVQEAIPEDLILKQALFADIERLAPARATLATNTSSLRLNEIAARMHNPSRLIGIHWVSPPYIVPVVEVVEPANADPAAVSAATSLLRGVGKVPLLVKDVPGFLVNRLQSAYRAAALSLIDQGIATHEDIDAAVKYAIAPRQFAYGMFRLYDLVVSAKTSLAVGEYLYRETGDSRYDPGAIMRRMVDENRLGLVSGKGWYDYSELSPDVVQTRRDIAILAAYRAQAQLESLFDIEDQPAESRLAEEVGE